MSFFAGGESARETPLTSVGVSLWSPLMGSHHPRADMTAMIAVGSRSSRKASRACRDRAESKSAGLVGKLPITPDITRGSPSSLQSNQSIGKVNATPSQTDEALGIHGPAFN